MLIVRSPMRVSYVGGGSDYEKFYYQNQGNVLGTAINQYIYVFSNPLSEIAREKIRFTYRKTESVSELSEIEHPVLREMLIDQKWSRRINIGTFSELPAGVGLGGSSAFTVGLAKLLSSLSGVSLSNEELAEYAIKVERKILKEPGGIQDQLHSAHGGFNHFSFVGDKPLISKTEMPKSFSDFIEMRQLLVWVGSARESGTHAKVTEDAINDDNSIISFSSKIASKASEEILESTNESERFEILCEAVKLGWQSKRKYIADTNSIVEEIEDRAYRAGASAVKLCGAGGSGFVLILFEAKRLRRLLEQLSSYSIIIPKLDHSGTVIIHQEIN